MASADSFLETCVFFILEFVSRNLFALRGKKKSHRISKLKVLIIKLQYQIYFLVCLNFKRKKIVFTYEASLVSFPQTNLELNEPWKRAGGGGVTRPLWRYRAFIHYNRKRYN